VLREFIKTIQFCNTPEPWRCKISDAVIQFCAAYDGMSSLEVWLSRVLAPSNVFGDEQCGRPLSSWHRRKGAAAPLLRTDARKVIKVDAFEEYR
jgi:hypothetical protein